MTEQVSAKPQTRQVYLDNLRDFFDYSSDFPSCISCLWWSGYLDWRWGLW